MNKRLPSLNKSGLSVTLVATVFMGVGAISTRLNAQPTGVLGYEAIRIGGYSADALDELARVVEPRSSDLIRAGVWINGEWLRFDPPPGYSHIAAYDISPTTGVIVGLADNAHGGCPIAWRIGHGSVLLQNLVGACSATAANDSNGAVGFCDPPARAAFWDRRVTPIDLGDLGGGRASAYAINEHGEIAGLSSRPDDPGVSVPVMWKPDGEIVDLFAESSWPREAFFQRGFAQDINNLGEIIGELPSVRGAFYWHDGGFRIIPEANPACGYRYDANALNDAGLMVGVSSDEQCEGTAVIWDRAQNFEAYIIDDYLFRQPDIELSVAKDINNAGQIVAYYDTGSDVINYLLTPYQFNLSDPVPGVAGQMNTITVTNLAPNQRVILAFGTEEGAQPIGNGCLGGLVLIRDAHTHPSLEAFANESGIGTFEVIVPQAITGKTVRYQTIAPNECEISHTVEYTF